jgi:uncharacterized membrane protein (TIGR02234 family)
MPPRRQLAVAVLAIALGGALLLLAAGRVWAAKTLPTATGARQRVSVPGHDVAPSLSALGLALLALALTVLATRSQIRRIVGLVVVVLGAAALAVAVRARGHVAATLAAKAFGVKLSHPVRVAVAPWWLVAAGGAAVAVLAGALVTMRGATWVSMGARYDAPAARVPRVDPQASAWEALDRGDDPTA